MATVRIFLLLSVITLGKSLEPVKNCTKPGPFCETCSSLVACVQDSDGSWTKNPLAKCDLPSRCVSGVCTTVEEPFCWGTADLEFPCKSVGAFPDPFYCNKFVLCVKEGARLKPYLNECPPGFGFDIKTDLCDSELGDGQCPETLPVPICTQAGQSGALDGKPAMYYICEQYSEVKKVLYPVLDVCPGAQVYEEYQCVDKGGTTTVPTTMTTVPTTTEMKTEQ
ncbi:uncharacterized protein LOC660437 [Tribolium castaneum]|uniref:Chitin-binding type-2 domain-containing protein n=1 Tax=Tribolium castaneum TaxID=7070 RepID=D6WY58_TRICA|nr:PREDICTED: uncharacterized protein LOC660437 [Tribolium castaneum]EFA07893.1 hypothetical protein TcasGA2_TC005468 [Tribolium castaneum]|eukprot:XP_971761.1 PREDICTED: uncharacterized protein LOC660437 [Tribolium castaneum]